MFILLHFESVKTVLLILLVTLLVMVLEFIQPWIAIFHVFTHIHVCIWVEWKRCMSFPLHQLCVSRITYEFERCQFLVFSGKNVVTVDSPVGRLGLTVCYDLRFPELYQNLRFQHDAQVQTGFLSWLLRSYLVSYAGFLVYIL